MSMRLVVGALATVIAAAGILSGHAGPGPGDQAQAAKRGGGPYLGPRKGGTSWVPSRPTKKSIVWAVGDSADGRPSSQAVAAMVARQQVDRFLYLGDVYETGTASEFASRYAPLYSGWNAIAAPTPGNHEWPNLQTGYIPYWTAAKGSPPPFWYAFAVSGWQVISLNSNGAAGDGSPQLTWLRTTIARSPRFGSCRLAFMHEPRFSAGPHGDDLNLDSLFQALSGHAAILLSGHDHDMERLLPVNGITPLVMGSGGKTLNPLRADPRLAFADNTHYGALRLALRPGSAVISFVAADGAVLDQSTVGCRQG